MGKINTICRNCGEQNILCIEKGAIVAPFFASRVWGINSVSLIEKGKKARLLNFLTLGFSNRIGRNAHMWMDAMFCNNCHFFQL